MKRNQSLEERDNFVKENCCGVESRGGTEGYDIFSFEGMDYKTAQTCIKNGWLDPKETQNDSPSVKEIIDFLKANPSFTAIGYVVSPKRPDTRISFEGVIATKEPSVKEYREYVNTFRHADEFDSGMPYRAWFD
jgi:hypothetical protein